MPTKTELTRPAGRQPLPSRQSLSPRHNGTGHHNGPSDSGRNHAGQPDMGVITAAEDLAKLWADAMVHHYIESGAAQIAKAPEEMQDAREAMRADLKTLNLDMLINELTATFLHRLSPGTLITTARFVQIPEGKEIFQRLPALACDTEKLITTCRDHPHRKCSIAPPTFQPQRARDSR